MQIRLICKPQLSTHTAKPARSFFIALAMAMQILGTTACGNKEEAPNPQVIAAQQKAEEANKQRALAEQKAAELAREKKAAEDASAQSRNIAIGLGLVTVLALLIGIGMESSARKAAAKSRNTSDE